MLLTLSCGLVPIIYGLCLLGVSLLEPIYVRVNVCMCVRRVLRSAGYSMSDDGLRIHYDTCRSHWDSDGDDDCTYDETSEEVAPVNSDVSKSLVTESEMWDWFIAQYDFAVILQGIPTVRFVFIRDCIETALFCLCRLVLWELREWISWRALK